MKKWSLILLLWYIFVDNTPWIQDPEKKTVWILRPGWSEEECWELKTKLFEKWNGDNKKFMCIDMDQEAPIKIISSQELINQLRSDIVQLIRQLHPEVK